MTSDLSKLLYQEVFVWLFPRFVKKSLLCHSRAQRERRQRGSVEIEFFRSRIRNLSGLVSAHAGLCSLADRDSHYVFGSGAQCQVFEDKVKIFDKFAGIRFSDPPRTSAVQRLQRITKDWDYLRSFLNLFHALKVFAIRSKIRCIEKSHGWTTMKTIVDRQGGRSRIPMEKGLPISMFEGKIIQEFTHRTFTIY